MKVLLSIFLLVATCMYILPVKKIFADKHKVCMADMGEQEDDCCKKEKAKEFFNFMPCFTFITNVGNNTHFYFIPALTALLHTVETPPPNLA